MLDGREHVDEHAEQDQRRADPLGHANVVRVGRGGGTRREFPQEQAEPGDHEPEPHHRETGPYPGEQRPFGRERTRGSSCTAVARLSDVLDM